MAKTAIGTNNPSHEDQVTMKKKGCFLAGLATQFLSCIGHL
jgi:hypothetical protein